jgi:hypothetical protein
MTAFAFIAGVLAYHVHSTLALPGVEVEGRAGLLDFRDQAYYPALSVLEGMNPYDGEAHLRRYPVVKILSPYSPVMLALFLPFGMLPLGIAQALYYVANLGLVLALAFISLRLGGWPGTTAQVFGLGTLALLSRPGEWNAVLGHFGALGATAVGATFLFSRSMPTLAGAALAVSMFKPTYGVPLAVLMLAWGARRTVAVGLLLASLMSVPIVGALARSAGGLKALVVDVGRSYSAWRAGYGNAMETPLRVDAAAVVARIFGQDLGTVGELAVSAALLMLGALLMRRLSSASNWDQAPAVAASTASLVILVAFYHQPYDLLLLLPLLTALFTVVWRSGGAFQETIQTIVFGLLLLPMMNYFTFGKPASWLESVGVTRTASASLNGVAVLLALIIWGYVVLRRTREGGTAGGRDVDNPAATAHRALLG